MDAGMADESIEALELAWQDLFRRILKAGHEQGERAAFDRILRSIHEVAGHAAAGHAVAGEIGPPAAVAPATADQASDGPGSVVPIRSGGREWETPG